MLLKVILFIFSLATNFQSIYGWKLQGRIVGGLESRPTEWPFMISLFEMYYNEENEIEMEKFKCGASLIGQFWAITAAHCVYRKDAANFRLRIGETRDFPHGKKVIHIHEFICHPLYRHGMFTNDIALIRFMTPVTFDTEIYPISLPLSKEDDYAGKLATVIGWGSLGERPNQRPKYLNHVELPVMSNFKCQQILKLTSVFQRTKFHHSWLCAGYLPGGKDACDGDSGGPLAVQENGQWTLIGIVSAGFGCARPFQPGIYARVTKFLDWIACVTANYDVLDDYYHCLTSSKN
ncbi:vitamin K-dependent protein C-like [Tetranychus urticae]|uniref:limulus clotting factor C n=1 Tax=Tetranychus urticae TaxID=32264 RepID=T1L584_TETUR|nr:vitamin K-dependent protein C-like [Tetranychus urticae]